MAFKNDDYVEVNERIMEFRDKHPEGTLQSEVILWPTADVPFIAVRATAYRMPGDPSPGHGLAWENFPGLTNFTRNSELQNAETSAWGRALIAVGAADAKKGIASANEIRRAAGAKDQIPRREAGEHPRSQSSGAGVPVGSVGATGSPDRVPGPSRSGQSSGGASKPETTAAHTGSASPDVTDEVCAKFTGNDPDGPCARCAYYREAH